MTARESRPGGGTGAANKSFVGDTTIVRAASDKITAQVDVSGMSDAQARLRLHRVLSDLEPGTLLVIVTGERAPDVRCAGLDWTRAGGITVLGEPLAAAELLAQVTTARRWAGAERATMDAVRDLRSPHHPAAMLAAVDRWAE